MFKKLQNRSLVLPVADNTIYFAFSETNFIFPMTYFYSRPENPKFAIL